MKWMTRWMMILAACLISISALADRYPPFAFELEEVPAYGEGDYITGRIYASGEPYIGNEMAVKCFLRVAGDDTWWPKPTNEQPYVIPDEESGLFALQFNTGGEDRRAAELKLMILRTEDREILDCEQANLKALCVTTIHRSAEGNLEILNSYRAEEAWLEDLGMDIGFYTRPGSGPGDSLSEDQIRLLLRAAAAYTSDVRFYAASGEVAKAYPIAKKMGFRAAGTAWLDGGENDQAELDVLIDLCNQGLASTAIVGNETLLKGTFTEMELMESISYVRRNVHDPEIVVTTAETPEIWMSHPALMDVCDAVAVNLYPFWNGYTAETGETYLTSAIDALMEMAPDQSIIISETGWPTKGTDESGGAEQTIAIRQAYDLQWQYYPHVSQVYWFALADEPWKASEEGEAGAHWGILDQELNAKEAVYKQYWGQ